MLIFDIVVVCSTIVKVLVRGFVDVVFSYHPSQSRNEDLFVDVEGKTSNKSFHSTKLLPNFIRVQNVPSFTVELAEYETT